MTPRSATFFEGFTPPRSKDHPITRDAKETTLSVAKSPGLRGATNPNACLMDSALDRASVFARVSTRHKIAIAEAFQARGAIVAMTGDGGE